MEREQDKVRTGNILMTLRPFPIQNELIPPPCFQTARTAARMLPAFLLGGFDRFDLPSAKVPSEGSGGRKGAL